MHLLVYKKLSALVASGKLVCPASDTVIYEVLRQTDLGTRLMTAGIIDELSGGFALQETFGRIRTEVLHFFRSQQEDSDRLYPLSDWVWTRPCWILGELCPHSESVTPEVQTMLQIGFFEEMARLGVADLVRRLGDAPVILFGGFFDHMARRLTEEKFNHSDELHNRKQTFLTEIEGVLDACYEDIAGALAYVRNTDLVPPEEVRAEIKVIVEKFRTDKTGTALPGMPGRS